MSIREYLQATRIDHAAERLRQGDKVESVLATVGWRGRKNFFRHFKERIGTTPAQYRDSWVATSRALNSARPSSQSPHSVNVRSSSSFQSV
jgi:methylphosphotriester-DNA--protein-cysteine methyltransferase